MNIAGASSRSSTGEAANITSSRGAKSGSCMMADFNRPHMGLQDSLCVDSILSKSEMEEVREMLASEDRSTGGRKESRLQFMTSTQMQRGYGKDEGGLELASPSILMLPIMDPKYQNPSCVGRRSYVTTNNRFSILANDLDFNNSLNIMDESCPSSDRNTGLYGEACNEKRDAIVVSDAKADSTNEVSTLGAVDPDPGQSDPDPGPNGQCVTNPLSPSSGNLVTEG